MVHTPENDMDIDPVSNDALVETEDTIMAEENNDEDEIDIGVDDHTSNIFTEAVYNLFYFHRALKRWSTLLRMMWI